MRFFDCLLAFSFRQLEISDELIYLHTMKRISLYRNIIYQTDIGRINQDNIKMGKEDLECMTDTFTDGGLILDFIETIQITNRFIINLKSGGEFQETDLELILYLKSNGHIQLAYACCNLQLEYLKRSGLNDMNTFTSLQDQFESISGMYLEKVNILSKQNLKYR